MANLKAIRKRIASAKNTQKITRAMKLVASAKLRRAQQQVLAHRPYATHLGRVVKDLAQRAGEDAHPLLRTREQRRVELLVLNSDRGLCGGFNANINRTVDRLLTERFADCEELRLSLVGRKGREYHARRHRDIASAVSGVVSANALEHAGEIARRLIALYTEGEGEAGQVDAVYLVYNEFKSAISQTVITEQLLPLSPAEIPEDGLGPDFVYEPSKQVLLDTLLPMYLNTQIYRALLESIASELGARMSAMDSATNNAADMISRLTLEFNRARQAAITKELMEIIGGAEALKG